MSAPPTPNPSPPELAQAETLAPGPPAVPAPAGVAPTVPGYEILDELGRGGMGVVYRARQLGLNRLVALKMILGGGHSGSQDRERFRLEAEAVARLQHPSIVQIHEVGEHDGLPFFSLEYVEGGSLAARLDGTPWPVHRAAALVETLARAMHYAHQRGIVHRDLKPANVLIADCELRIADSKTPTVNDTGSGVFQSAIRNLQSAIKITDFGLAKQLDSAHRQTQTGAVLGTPSYMAPEQAGGTKGIGPAVDVYALGAILYELLTGRPPFKAATPLDTVLQVISNDPVAPTKLQPKLPRDLETICLKCLQKEPAKRYATADALADDLARWQKNEPILARPTPAWERAAKWARRRPAVAALSLFSVLVTIIGFALVTWKWQEATDERRSAQQALQSAELNLYFNHIALAEREWFANNPGRTRELLDACPEALRRWEWHYLHHLGQTDLLTLPAEEGTVAYSPDGTLFAFPGPDHRVVIWDMAHRQRVRTLSGQRHPLTGLAFSPDGSSLAAVSRDLRSRAGGLVVWNLSDGHQVFARSSPTDGAFAVAFSSDGMHVITADGDLIQHLPVGIVIRDAVTGEEVRTLQGAIGSVSRILYSPDGKTIAAAEFSYSRIDCQVKTWEADTGKPLPGFRGHLRGITDLAFSPDGTHLASASADSTIRVWDVSKRQELYRLQRHTGLVYSVAFSPDGKQLASAGSDKTLRICEASTGKETTIYRGHSGPAVSIAYHPTGRHVAVLVRGSGVESSSGPAAQGEVKIWDVTAGQDAITHPANYGAVLGFALSPDGRFAVTAGFDGQVIQRDLTTGRQVGLPRGMPGQCNGVAYSADGHLLAVRDAKQALRVVELATSKEVFRSRQPIGPLRQVAFRPDARFVATDCGEPFLPRPGELTVWDMATGEAMLRRTGRGIAFAPDNSTFAWGSEDGAVHLTDIATGQDARSLSGQSGGVLTLAFSGDGRYLAAGDWDRTVRLWEVGSGQLLRTLHGHAEPVRGLAFAPDSDRLATASLGVSGKGEIKLWDVATGKEALTLDGNAAVAFSRDGHRLVGLNVDFYLMSELKVWDAASHRP